MYIHAPHSFCPATCLSYQLTSLPAYQLTSLPAYQLANLPAYQLTSLQTYRISVLCLPICLPTYGYLFAYLSAFPLTCLSTYLPSHLHTCLPTYLPAYLPVCPPTLLPTYLSSHLPAWSTYRTALLPACPVSHLVYLPTYSTCSPTFLPTYPPTWQPAHLPTYLFAGLSEPGWWDSRAGGEMMGIASGLWLNPPLDMEHDPVIKGPRVGTYNIYIRITSNLIE